MDNNLRLQYLRAMGIDVWVPRKTGLYPSELSIVNTETSGTIEEGVSVLEAHSARVVEPDSDYQPGTTIPEGNETDNDWTSLQEEVAGCRRCALCETRTQTVFGTGNKNADWMLIGEAPGQSEDREGKPFVGKAGLLLTEMLRAMGLSRDEVFIANILKCRPPNNRDPKPEEVRACAQFLQRQIAEVRPQIILAVGRVAAQNLLKTDSTIGKLRGDVHHYGGTPVVVIYHPAYLLRSLMEKRKSWRDLQMAMKVFRDIENKGK